MNCKVALEKGVCQRPEMETISPKASFESFSSLFFDGCSVKRSQTHDFLTIDGKYSMADNFKLLVPQIEPRF